MMLKGERINLTPLVEADRGILFDWINDRKEIGWNAPYRPVHSAAHDTWFDAVQSQSDIAFFAIRKRADQQLIGTCQLHSIQSVHQSAELQIRIGVPEERGRGLGVEAIRLLVSFGFNDLNLHRIYLHVFADNTRAITAYDKVGFTREGLARQAAFVEGTFRDIVQMAILRNRQA